MNCFFFLVLNIFTLILNLRFNHLNMSMTKKHSRLKHGHVTTSDQSEISVMLASGPSAVAGTLSIEQAVFNANVFKIVHTLGYERIESAPQPADPHGYGWANHRAGKTVRTGNRS